MWMAKLACTWHYNVTQSCVSFKHWKVFRDWATRHDHFGALPFGSSDHEDQQFRFTVGEEEGLCYGDVILFPYPRRPPHEPDGCKKKNLNMYPFHPRAFQFPGSQKWRPSLHSQSQQQQQHHSQLCRQLLSSPLPRC